MKYLISIVTALMFIVLLATYEQAKAPKINVEIYLTEGELIYCATGTLAPPAVYMGSGSVIKGQESYC